jgi:hypothetical protein
MQQIVQAIERKSGALFPSATAPRIVVGLLSSLQNPKKTREERIKLIPVKPRPARASFRAALSKRIPIGLSRCELHSWMNSLIQFFLFLPGSWELFSLIPKSFQFFREFADQYFADQEENRPTSSADSTALIHCLIHKLPSYFLQKKPILYEILSGLMKGIFPNCPFAVAGEIHSVVLHPEWHVASEYYDFEETFKKTLSESPPEILVGFRGAPFAVKCHYFASSTGVDYDLDAFVELRPDGEQGEHHIAYLKCHGAWYQCDDDRVIQVRSNCLSAPLRRAILLHYRRNGFGMSHSRCWSI